MVAMSKSDAAMDAAARLMDRGFKACERRGHSNGSSYKSKERDDVMRDFMQSSMECARISVRTKKDAKTLKRGLDEAAIRLGYKKRREFTKVRVLTYVERGVQYVQMQKVEVRRD